MLPISTPSPLVVRVVDPEPRTPDPYPSTTHGGRLCVAVPAGRKFAIESRVSADARGERFMYTVAVDGRDTLTNQDASALADGLVSRNYYLCKGFRTSDKGVHEFVCVELGRGATTGERNGTADCSGLAAVAVYAEKAKPPRVALRANVRRSSGGSETMGWHNMSGVRGVSLDGDVLRGPATVGYVDASAMTLCAAGSSTAVDAAQAAAPTFSAGPSAGAAAGAFVVDAVGETTFDRGDLVGEVVVEYDTLEGWAARGVSFAPVPPLDRSPWPADTPRSRFADPSTL